MATFCLTQTEIDKIKDAVKSGKLSAQKMMNAKSSEERRAMLAKFTSEENATQVNALFEQKLLLKSQKRGMVTWIKKVTGENTPIRRDLLSKIDKMDSVLDAQGFEDFKADLVKTRLGFNVTYEEAKYISELSENRRQAWNEWSDIVRKNPKWTSSPKSTRKEWMNHPSMIRAGIAQTVLESYVNELKIKSKGVNIRKEPLKALKNSFYAIPSFMKSMTATFDNSFWGRQGLPSLLGSPAQKRIWARNFAKSFGDIAKELVKYKRDGLTPMELARAEVVARPSAVNGAYRVGGYRLDTLMEEAFPSSLPEKIPLFGRVFKGAETAFGAGALRMRADLADMYIEQMTKSGLNPLNKREAQAVGELVGSMTGRARLGRLEPIADMINVWLFSPRFFKATIDNLTAHQLNQNATKFSKKEATKNLVSIVAHIALIYVLASILFDDDAIDKDPRSTNFGKIKIGNVWYDITGGHRGLVILASRILPSKLDGQWGQWSKSGQGTWTNLRGKDYGQQDAVDAVMDSVLFNKLSPFARVLYDSMRGEMFGGEPFNIKKSITQSTMPISMQQFFETKASDGYATAIALVIGDAFGFSGTTSGYKSDWNANDSARMKNFKQQVGDDKFKSANEDFNRAYNEWTNQVRKTKEYRELSSEEQKELNEKARGAIKDKILKEYGEKKQKATTDKEKEARMKNLMPK